jgi:hypothetical protein
MSKPFIKRKFKYDVESDSETEPFNKNQSEVVFSETVVTRYLCDQFDLAKIFYFVDQEQLDVDVTAPK